MTHSNKKKVTAKKQFFAHVIKVVFEILPKFVSGKRLAQLETIERRYHELIDSLNIASMAIVVTRADGRIGFTNKRMQGLLEHTKSKQLSEALHPDDQQKYLNFRDNIVASAVENSIEVRYNDVDNCTRWLKIDAKPINDGKTSKGKYLPYLATIEDITEQKTAQEKIKTSEEKYRTILDTISDEYWETDLEGNFVFWNRAFAENSGLTSEEIKRLKPKDWISEELNEYLISEYSKVAITGNPALLETEVSRWNKEKTDLVRTNIQMSVHSKRDIDDNPIGFFGFTRDISELKQAESALRESEEKFKVMSDQSVLGISIVQDDKSLYRNDALTKIFGYSHQEMDELFSSSFLYEKVLHPDRRDFVRDQYLKKQKGVLEGQVTHYQYKMYTKQGEIKWVDQYSKTVSYQGRPANLVSMIDITDQKIAEEALTQSQHRLANHIESTPMGVIEFNNEFLITAWNPAAEKIFGYSKEEAIGSSTFDILVPEYEYQRVKKIHLFEDAKSNENINDNMTKDGRIITVQWFNTPISDIDGNLIGMAAACQDITEQKKTQEMLVQSEKMTSVGSLAAGMAHEINNPLGAILQLSQNLGRRLSPDFEKNLLIAESYNINLNDLHGYLEERGILGFLEAILESGKRAAKIITDMLHFSRKSETEIVPLDLNGLIERGLELARQDYDLKKKYDFRHINVETEFATGLTMVPCSETEIEQVILNLLKNAAQSMEKKENGNPSRIILRTMVEQNMARIEVEDNGPGIEESVKSNIFEPFFTTKPVGEGTGLGLSVSYMIITGNHNGTLEVESDLGKGTRFIIRLPLISEVAS